MTRRCAIRLNAADSAQLLTITHTSIEYITKRTQFEQTSHAIPQTLQTPLAAKRTDYKGAPYPLLPASSEDQGLTRSSGHRDLCRGHCPEIEGYRGSHRGITEEG
jgi:hypothetical protein